MKLFQVSAKIEMTIYPGTPQQKSSTEWQGGFVMASSSADACAMAKSWFKSRATANKIVKVHEVEAHEATNGSVGFFVQFCIP